MNWFAFAGMYLLCFIVTWKAAFTIPMKIMISVGLLPCLYFIIQWKLGDD